MKLAFLLLAATLAAATPALPALAHGRVTHVEKAKFEADRAAILGMAGNYKVRFDFKETTPWRADYTPIPAKVSGGHESIRVIEDTGRVIRLQHLLVIEAGGKPVVIKHWRQDWTYEPNEVLVYAGPNTWKLEPVPERMRKGRWSQTVWQTDDSPRYGGWGVWETQGGVPRWRSNWTWRPLARRDATRKPPYDRYLAINRHSPTPSGWIHWQDNLKMGLVDGKVVPFVQEIVLNSYERFDGYEVKAAEDYWARTKDYWAAVRAAWDHSVRDDGMLTVTEEADNGSVTAHALMGFADDIAKGETTTPAAVAEARAVIARGTGARALSLHAPRSGESAHR